MSTKIKMSVIVQAVESGALKKIEGSRPPWNVRVTCARFAEQVLAEYRRYKNLFTKAVMQYGVETTNAEGQKAFMVAHPSNSADNIKAFGEAIEDLRGTEVELACEPLSAATLGEAAGDLTVGDIRSLGPLLVD